MQCASWAAEEGEREAEYVYWGVQTDHLYSSLLVVL